MSSSWTGSFSWLPGTQEDLVGWAEAIAEEKQEGRVYTASLSITDELSTHLLTRAVCLLPGHALNSTHVMELTWVVFKELALGASPGCPRVRSLSFRNSPATHSFTYYVSSCNSSLPQFPHW